MGLATAFRIANVVLCILYMPLLYFRLQAVRDDERLYLLGVFVLFVGLIGASYNRRSEGFIPSLPIVTAGLLIMIASSSWNQWRHYKRHRGSVPRGRE